MNRSFWLGLILGIMLGVAGSFILSIVMWRGMEVL